MLSVRESLPIVETALRALASGDALSAARHNLATKLEANRESVLKVWSAVLPSADAVAVRITPGILDVEMYSGRAVGEPVAAAPGNTYTGLIVVLSIRTTELLGVVHDGYLGQLGVSVPAGIAAGYLARPDVSVVGILGAGAQARQQLEAVTAVRNVAEARVFTPRLQDAKRFASEMRDRFGVPIAACGDRRRAVEGCNVVIAATSAPGAVFEADWVGPGTHVSVTRPTEVPDELLARGPQIFSAGLDPGITLTQGGAGALWQARQKASTRFDCQVKSLSDLVSGAAAGRRSLDEITLFGPFCGQAPSVLWPALGSEVLRRAQAEGMGRMLPLEWFLQTRPS